MADIKRNGQRTIAEIARDLATKAGRNRKPTAMDFCIRECLEADRLEVQEGYSRSLLAVSLAEGFLSETGVLVKADTMATNRRRIDERLGLNAAQRLGRLDGQVLKQASMRSFSDLERLLDLDVQSDTATLGEAGYHPAGAAARFLRGRTWTGELGGSGNAESQSAKHGRASSKASAPRQFDAPKPSRAPAAEVVAPPAGLAPAITAARTLSVSETQTDEQRGLFAGEDDIDAENEALRAKIAAER